MADVTVDRMLESLYEKPEGYHRGDLLVTLQVAGHDISIWQLPKEVTRDDIGKLAGQFGVSNVERAWKDRSYGFSHAVRLLSEIEGGRGKKCPPELTDWLTRVAEGDADFPHSYQGELDDFIMEWAGGVLNIALDLPQIGDLSVIDADFDRVLNMFGDRSDWFELANRYYQRMVIVANMEDYSKEDYSRAIICLTLYTPNSLERSPDEMDDWFEQVAIQHPHMPFSIRDLDDGMNLWFEANQATRLGCSSNYDPDLVFDSNQHVIEEGLREFTESAGPMAAWLESQYKSCWYFQGEYEEHAHSTVEDRLPAIMYYFFADIEAALEQYPLLDEEHHSMLEMEQQSVNARDQVPHRLIGDVPEVDDENDWGGALINELHEVLGDDWWPESADGGFYIGNWPEDDAPVALALLNLGFLTSDIDEWFNLIDTDTLDADDWVNAIDSNWRPQLRAAMEMCADRVPSTQLAFPGVEEMNVQDRVVEFFRHLMSVYSREEDPHGPIELDENLVREFGDMLLRCGAPELGHRVLDAVNLYEPFPTVMAIFFPG